MTGGRLTMREALDRLPKVELHCHIEGTMRPHTVAELARKNGRPFPVDDPTDLYRYTSLDSFLTVFWLVQECLADRGDWARLAYESVVDGAAHGLIYRESFFTPARHLAAGQDLGEIVAGIEEGLEAAERDTGARVLLIADIDKAYGPRAGLEMVERLIGLRSNGLAQRVIGMGMDSTELGVDPLQFREAYRLGERSGLRLTGHQGETSPPSTIWDVVEDLHCERVDHGLSILDDLEVVGRVRDRSVPLTVCPISNVKIANAVARLEDHPWPRMRAAGLHVTLNTDDPAMIDDDLGLEYAAVAEAFGYTFDDMVATSVAGVDATWLNDEEKAALRRRVTDAAADLRSLMAGAG
ncbi:MAG TPA: adenosine deaminase [Actinobacteria bacterium]|nr:adenosine deaminase [Actinomycetota bacterium]